MNHVDSELHRQHAQWQRAQQRIIKGVECPCCGSRVPALPIEGLASVPVTTQQRRILDAMVRAYPRIVGNEYLFDAVWGDRADGGPNGDLMNQIAVQMVKINRVIRPLGWQLSGAYNGRAGAKRLMQIKPRTNASRVKRT